MNGTELRSFSHFQILTSKSDTRTLAEIFKLTNFEVCLHSVESCESQSKSSNSNVNLIYKCSLNEWNSQNDQFRM